MWFSIQLLVLLLRQKPTFSQNWNKRRLNHLKNLKTFDQSQNLSIFLENRWYKYGRELFTSYNFLFIFLRMRVRVTKQIDNLSHRSVEIRQFFFSSTPIGKKINVKKKKLFYILKSSVWNNQKKNYRLHSIKNYSPDNTVTFDGDLIKLSDLP